MHPINDVRPGRYPSRFPFSRLSICLSLLLAVFSVSPAIGQTTSADSAPVLHPRRALIDPSESRPGESEAQANLRQLVAAHPNTPVKVVTGEARFVDRYNPEGMLRLTIGVAPPKMDEEEQFLAELQNPDSPNFHKYLTAEEFNARFAPSVQDEQAVVDWLTSNGLTITMRYPNRLLVDAEAPVKVIEKAFGVQINHYQLDDAIEFSNDREPVIPSHLNGILDYIGGMDSIQRVHSAYDVTPQKKQPDYVAGPVFRAGASITSDGDPNAQVAAIETVEGKSQASHLENGLQVSSDDVQPNLTGGLIEPSDIFSPYGYDFTALQALGHCCNPTGSTTGSLINSTIDVVAAGDFDDADVKAFLARYPNLVSNYAHLYVDGGGLCCAGETTLDVEWSIATSNSMNSSINTTRVLVYDAPNSFMSTFLDVYNAMASNGDSRIMTESFGCAEGDCAGYTTMLKTHQVFNSMVAAGWTLLASSGDNGATPDCSSHVNVVYPASDWDVVGVGGTTLGLNNDGSFASETGWQGTQNPYACASNAGGSGGGCSNWFHNTYFQTSPVCAQDARSVPDIALNAGAGQGFVFQGVFQGVGGTSIATPEVAGFVSQENAYLSALGNICGTGKNAACGPIGQMNFPLYKQGYANQANHQYAPHNPFYDITSGCNSNYYTTLNGLGFECAGTGYDMVTGWGSFNALQMAWAMNYYTLIGNQTPMRPNVAFVGPAGSFSSKVWYNTPQTVQWSITGQTAGILPASGVAGYSSAWDGSFDDPETEAHQGIGNSFYSGPEAPNSHFGEATLTKTGCHTLTVIGWDNTGLSTENQNYQTFCYDPTPPAVTASVSPSPNAAGWITTTNAAVKLTAADPGTNPSGVANVYFSRGNNPCAPTSLTSCSTYLGLPIAYPNDGVSLYLYFASDNAGNYSTPAVGFVKVDATPPVTTATLTGTLANTTVYTSPVSISLSATDATSGVSSTSFAIDGGAYQPYSSPIGVGALGNHYVQFYSVDVAGNREATHLVSFSVAEATSTTLTVSPNPAIGGQTITLTATVSAASSPVTSGQVYFYNGTTEIGYANLSNGVGSTNITSLSAFGNNSLTAKFNGITHLLASTSAAVVVDYQRGTTTAVSATPNPAVAGQPVTITATVTPVGLLAGTATGYVQFQYASTSASVALNNGKAVFTTSALPVGSNTVAVQYLGSLTFGPSVANPTTVTVNKGTTTTALTSSLNPSQYLQPVKFSAAITSAYGQPAGTVSFESNGTVIGTVSIVGGIATLTTPLLAVGSENVTAIYQGSTSYTGSTSSVLGEGVKPAATAVSIASSLNPAGYGQPVAVTVSVSNANGGIPTGTVTLTDGTNTVGSATLLNGSAQIRLIEGTLSFPPSVGAHSLTASYSGSADFQPSTSPVLTETIQQGVTSITLTSSIYPATALSTITFTATVDRAAGVYPTGTVTFYDGRTKLGPGTLSSTGVATFAATGLTVGTHTIFAMYGGDANYLTSTSPVLNETVNPLI